MTRGFQFWAQRVLAVLLSYSVVHFKEVEILTLRGASLHMKEYGRL